MMSINSIHQGPAASALDPFGTASPREISSQDKTQLLRTTILSEKLDSELASAKALMEDASKLLHSLPPKSDEFPNFWADMSDTVLEKEGLDAIEQQLSHLKTKGSQMMLYLKLSPGSAAKDQEIQKLTTFLQKEHTRISHAQTMNLFLQLQREEANSHSIDLSVFSKGVTDQTQKLTALTTTLLNSTPTIQASEIDTARPRGPY